MSTRCFIGKTLADGQVQGIYCHHDGYFSGVGRTLKEFYTSPSQVDALLALGDISSLGMNTDKGLTEAYHRDRGEDFNSNTTYLSVEEFLANVGTDMGAEYAYIFSGGGWKAFRV